jgi:hypothetical protein
MRLSLPSDIAAMIDVKSFTYSLLILVYAREARRITANVTKLPELLCSLK